eukprot:gene10270-10076_t
MFAILLLFMVSGFPVAFALAANGLLFGYIAIEQGLMNVALLQALPDRIFGIMSNETLLAIPFFTFMGLVLERSGMAEDLLETIGQLFGRVRGGLAYAVVLVGALLAATTGVVAASACYIGQSNSGARILKAVVFVLMPPLALVFLVLGTIFLGIATPTEGGAMGAVGALLIAASKKRLNLDLLKQSIDSTTKLSCFVLFILIGSTVFGLTFRAVEGDVWVEQLMGDLPGGELGFLIAVQILIFVLGFFLDFFEIAFIVIPLLVPVADKLGIDLVWFGVMIAMNMQTSFLTPPFGFSLFYLKSVTPKVVKTIEIYKGSLPFIALQLLMVVLIFAFPQLVIQEEKVKYQDSPLQLDLPAQNYGGGNDPAEQQPFVPSFSE